jgi:hypothetical protein
VSQNFVDAEQLGKVEAVHVVIVDHLRDDCLPTSDALRRQAETILRNADLRVVGKDDKFAHHLTIKVVGGELKIKEQDGPKPFGACTAAVASNLLRDEYLKDGSVGRVQAFMIMGYIFAMKDQFPQQLGVVIDEYVSALAENIIETRQKPQ